MFQNSEGTKVYAGKRPTPPVGQVHVGDARAALEQHILSHQWSGCVVAWLVPSAGFPLQEYHLQWSCHVAHCT